MVQRGRGQKGFEESGKDVIVQCVGLSVAKVHNLAACTCPLCQHRSWHSSSLNVSAGNGEQCLLDDNL